MTAPVLARGSGEAVPPPRDAAALLRTLVVRGPVATAVASVPVMALAGLAQQVGIWNPATAVAGVLLGVAAAAAVLRWIPVPTAERLPATAAGGIVLIALAAAVWAGVTHGEHVAVRRDAGAYATYALTLARTGGVPVDPGLDVFGIDAGDRFVRVSGGANYQVPVVEDGRLTDLEIVPQFFVGTPALLTLGWWTGGWTGLFAVPAILGGVAVVAFGALATALAGPRAGVIATATLALAQPVLLAFRQTYSEPAAMLFLFTWALLLVAALEAGIGRQRGGPAVTRPAFLAGALAGAGLFVRIDALREIVLLVPVVAVLVLLRYRAAPWLVLGIAVTGVPAALAATPWDSPYVNQVWPSLAGLLVAGIGLSVVATVVVAVVRTGRPALRSWRRVRPLLPRATAGVVLLAGLALASRPVWLVDRKVPRLPGAEEFVGSLQTAQGLPLDPTRTYAEHTVTWLTWWVGPVAVAAALAAAVVLTHRGVAAMVGGRVPPWVPALVVGLGATLLTLYRPAITPDHPWADRRLVSAAIPTAALLASVAVVQAGTWLGRSRRALTGVATLLCAALVLVPTAAATAPAARDRTEAGQPAAVREVCDALPERAAVIALDHASRVEWGPVLRSRCGVPLVGLGDGTQFLDPDLAAAVADAAGTARSNGYSPVLLSGSTAGGGGAAARRPPPGPGTADDWVLVVDLATTEPERLMTERPGRARPLEMRLWMMEM